MAKINARKEYIKLLVVLIVFVMILGGFVLYLSVPLLSATTVELATQPVDPFDIIRGQYIIIRYEIGTVPLVNNAEVGDSVYVILEEDEEGISRYDGASLIKPKDSIFIKGKITSIRSSSMNVEYGIEQYFFERGAKFSTRGMTVKAKLSGFGGSRIVELLQDGEPIEIDYRNKTLTS